MPSFNLIDEPWLPCLTQTGEPVELSLRETLVRSPELAELVHPSPLVTAALHRLLLAVLHRVFGPADEAAWGALWERGVWDSAALDAYLDRWRDRFDLFHSERPFYQVAGLSPDRAWPVSRLAHELPSPANPSLLFDHTVGAAFTPAEAAQYVVAQQSFALEGFVSLEPWEPSGKFKSAKAAPLTKAAVALVKGPSLFHTLLLNLHRYDPEVGEPFEVDDPAADGPAWERETGPQVVERVPDGYLDLLTWQSRRILLLPDADGLVRRVVLMKGDQILGTRHQRPKEPMVAFVAQKQAKKSEPAWQPVGLQEARAAWRDSLALVQSLPGKGTRPRMLDWISDLVRCGLLPRAAVYPLDLYGLDNEQMKVNFWRHERLPLPLVYLEDKDLVAALARALELAERADGALASGVDIFAQGLVGTSGVAHRGSKEVDNLLKHLAPDRLYWTRLEQPFRELAVSLPHDRRLEPDGTVTYGPRELPAWAHRVRRAAEEAFASAVRDLDGSGRALRAATEAEVNFRRRLRALVSSFLEEEGADEPTQ